MMEEKEIEKMDKDNLGVTRQDIQIVLRERHLEEREARLKKLRGMNKGELAKLLTKVDETIDALEEEEMRKTPPRSGRVHVDPIVELRG